MRKALLVARREYRATIRTKGFIIGLLLAPLLMGGSLIVFAIFKDRVDTKDQTLAVVDRSGLVADALVEAAKARNAAVVTDRETGKKVRPAYRIEIVPPDDEDPAAQQLALSDRVRSGEIHGFVEVGPGILHPLADPDAARITFHAQSPAIDDMRKWIPNPINVELRRRRLEEASVDPATVPDLFHWIQAEGLSLVTRDKKTGDIRAAERRGAAESLLVPLALPVLLFMMIMMGAQPRLNSVMEEKSQRIAEVVLGSITPFRFMAGKLIGGVAVALTAASVYVVGGAFVIAQQDLGAHVPYHVLPWFFAYLVLSIVMFGALFTAVGSACNDPTEAQSISFPAMLPVIFPLFVQMPVVTQPNSAFATGLSLVPFFTPMLMLIRQATPGGVPGWQPWVGLTGVLLTTVFLVWAGGRIFRVGILTQGTPPKLGNLIRWAIRG